MGVRLLSSRLDREDSPFGVLIIYAVDVLHFRRCIPVLRLINAIKADDGKTFDGDGQVERMNRTLMEATVQRYHYGTHAQLKAHVHAFLMAYNFAKRLKTLRGLTP